MAFWKAMLIQRNRSITRCGNNSSLKYASTKWRNISQCVFAFWSFTVKNQSYKNFQRKYTVVIIERLLFNQQERGMRNKS